MVKFGEEKAIPSTVMNIDISSACLLSTADGDIYNSTAGCTGATGYSSPPFSFAIIVDGIARTSSQAFLACGCAALGQEVATSSFVLRVYITGCR
mmetsp:Transcript_33597/g.58566  ORF Transcript_33597/g.58566 Transcript_33597/m.58566 type:complete len:95 (-) Transcript_33597:246-530(-)